jgi:ATP/ADP translocase
MLDIHSPLIALFPKVVLSQLNVQSGTAMVTVTATADTLNLVPRLTPAFLSHSSMSTAVAALALSGGASSPSASQTSFLTPEGKSVLCMAIAMAFHYLGYSLARSITVSLFTSSSTGYTSTAAFPFANAFVSPFSLLMLMGYNFVLERGGPRGALVQSTLFCALVVNAAALGIASCLKTNLSIGGIPAVKFITGPLFVFRESYVQLLTSQYWSFMASALTPNQSAKYFGPIAGLTSITSAVAGYIVSPLVRRLGLTGALMGTGAMLLCSLVTASMAYNIARKHGFEPIDSSKHSKTRVKGPNRTAKSRDLSEMGMIEKSTRLFQRVPVLKALFLEILASQGLATVLNVCFVTCLGTAIPNDDERAGWVGKFYSLINIVTMVLQFGVLPQLMTVIEPKALWRVIPLVSLLFTGVQAFRQNPSLYVVSASLLVMKISEYSARRMLDEMIFVPLDFESRFVGKEVLGVFGYRLGKSLMSLVMSGIAAIDTNFGLQKLSILSNLVCISWMRTAWTLSNMVRTRAEAEAAHKLGKQKVGGH